MRFNCSFELISLTSVAQLFFPLDGASLKRQVGHLEALFVIVSRKKKDFASFTERGKLEHFASTLL